MSLVNDDGKYRERCDTCYITVSDVTHTDLKELNRLNRLTGWTIEYYKDGEFRANCPECIAKGKHRGRSL